MAHHHHPQHHGSSSTPRPTLLRALSLITLLLPVLMYIISLALVLKSIYSPLFALSHPYDSQSNTLTNLTYKASPFYACTVSHAALIDDALTFNSTCARRPALGAKGVAACSTVANIEDPEQCRKVVVSAGLFVSGAVLIGLGLLLALLFLGLGYKGALAPTTGHAYEAVGVGREGEGEAKGGGGVGAAAEGAGPSIAAIAVPFLGACATILAVLAAGCIVLGQIVGVDSLVNTLKPTMSQLPDFQTRWYMGPAALVYPSVAWLAAVLGALIAGTGCGVLGR